MKGKPTPEQLEELRGVKEELQRTEQELAAAEAARDEALALVPNPPDDSAPDGDTEDHLERSGGRRRRAGCHRAWPGDRVRPVRQTQ